MRKRGVGEQTDCRVDGLFWVKNQVVVNRTQPPFVFVKLFLDLDQRGSSDNSGGGDKTRRKRRKNMQKLKENQIRIVQYKTGS
jgi:hypothetical protein